MGKGFLDKALGLVAVPLVVVLLSLLASTPAYGRSKSGDDLYVVAEISNKNPYEGEAVVLTYKLYSRVADIRFARRSEQPVLLDEKDGFVSALETDSRGHRENVEGNLYYVFPMESYVISPDRKGTYHFAGGSFEIGVDYAVVYEDPFWGRRRGYKTEQRLLPAPDLTIKAKSLPSSERRDEEEITTVGNFTVSTLLPPGEIILDQPARAIITLKGRGLLGEDVLPRYADAFKGESIKLKSMSENRKTYFDGKSVVSELTLDCEFIPQEKNSVIGEVGFSFFNPASGKYEEVFSSPVAVEAKSITTRIETVDI
ncbi:MAG: hypothetical protein K2M69_03090 [Muribaculaceae bacterium]|nr:hypothetical protein [Muribaculaceae bacterium]